MPRNCSTPRRDAPRERRRPAHRPAVLCLRSKLLPLAAPGGEPEGFESPRVPRCNSLVGMERTMGDLRMGTVGARYESGMARRVSAEARCLRTPDTGTPRATPTRGGVMQRKLIVGAMLAVLVSAAAVSLAFAGGRSHHGKHAQPSRSRREPTRRASRRRPSISVPPRSRFRGPDHGARAGRPAWPGSADAGDHRRHGRLPDRPWRGPDVGARRGGERGTDPQGRPLARREPMRARARASEPAPGP